jgi:hypothetical protein
MASNSEITFGARLNNASTLSTHLKSFKDYAPPKAEQSAANLDAVIENIKTQNSSTAGNKQVYTLAVDRRQKLFTKDPDSLVKLMSPLGAAVRSAFSKTSKEAAAIAAIIAKIHGEKIKKDKAEPNADSVSRSEKSYGSLTQQFSNIIATLQNFGGNYKPANKSITIAALNTKLQQLTQANTDVAAAYGIYIESTDERAVLYKSLTDLTQGIKDAVKSQYGLNSTEYKLVKSLKV